MIIKATRPKSLQLSRSIIGVPIRESHPHTLLHEQTPIFIFVVRFQRIDQVHIEAAEQLEESLVQFEFRDILTHAAEPAESKHQSGPFLHHSQAFGGSFQPALGTEHAGVFAIHLRVRAMKVPGALADLRARWEVDPIVGVALRANFARKQTGCGRIVAQSLLYACLQVWKLLSTRTGDDLREGNICGRDLGLQLFVNVRICYDGKKPSSDGCYRGVRSSKSGRLSVSMRHLLICQKTTHN